MGATIAEKLAREGHEVTLVTPFPGVGPAMDFTGENLFLQPQLRRLGVNVLCSHLLSEVRPGSAIGYSAATPDVAAHWSVEAIVLATSRQPEDAVYQELRLLPEALEQRGITGLYRIGDCFAPRLYVADTLFDGHRLAREIDTANPAEPLPYLRERALVGAV
jgi:dimethylamine/trimethylamine dehydrogenase